MSSQRDIDEMLDLIIKKNDEIGRMTNEINRLRLRVERLTREKEQLIEANHALKADRGLGYV